MGIRWSLVLAFASVCLTVACGEDPKPSPGVGGGGGPSESPGDGDGDGEAWSPLCQASNSSQVLLDDVDHVLYAPEQQSRRAVRLIAGCVEHMHREEY